MGRGYSANRSKSARPTNKTKRARSNSIADLRKELHQPHQTQYHVHGRTPAAPSSADAISAVERSVAKRAQATVAAAVNGQPRSRSQSVDKVVYLGKKVRTVRVTRTFTPKPKKEKEEGASEDDNAEQEEEEAFADEVEAEVSEDEMETVRRPDVFTKYHEAGKVVDRVLLAVGRACVPGASTKALCHLGDSEMLRLVSGLFKNVAAPKAQGGDKSGDRGKRSSSTVSNRRSMSARGRSRSANPLAASFDSGLPRGVAFPTNVSVNEMLCNHAPFNEEEAVTLAAGDVVKIHCGCHVDGFPVMAAQTVIVMPADGETAHTLTPSIVNAVEASRVAVAGAVHLMRPGAVNDDITDFIQSVGAHYDVEAVEGVLSTRVKRWITDSVSGAIICRRVTVEQPQQDVDMCEVGANQVWTLDVAFTNSNQYRMQVPPNAKNNSYCNIYRKNEITSSNPTLQDLRSRSAVELLNNDVRNRFHCFPFTPSHAEEPLKARLGLIPLKRTGQLDEFPELQCRPNSAPDTTGHVSKKAAASSAPGQNIHRAVTARFSMTVAVTERKVHVLCGGTNIVSDAFLSKAKAKGHKGAAETDAFAAQYGGLLAPAALYGALLPAAAGADFESEDLAGRVRLPTDRMQGLLCSSLAYGATKAAKLAEGAAEGEAPAVAATEEAVAAAEAEAPAGATVHAGDDDDNVREDKTARSKHRRAEPTTDDAAARRSKLLAMHPSRVNKKQ